VDPDIRFILGLQCISFQSAQLILTPQDYKPLTTYFYQELTLPQENVLLPFLAQNCGLQYQMIFEDFDHVYLFKWKLKKHLLHDKDTHELLQHFTYLEPKSVNSCIL